MFCLKYIPHSDIVLKFQDVTTKVISSSIAKVNYSVTCILGKQLMTDVTSERFCNGFDYLHKSSTNIY